MRDLSKYGSSAVVRGQGVTFADTTSPVDPGDRGKVAEAVDVCFPEKVSLRGRDMRQPQPPRPFLSSGASVISRNCSASASGKEQTSHHTRDGRGSVVNFYEQTRDTSVPGVIDPAA